MLGGRTKQLIGYRIATDVAAKGAFFLLTVLAARRLPRAEFGQLAVYTTMGWLSGVVTDLGLQLHMARSVSRADRGHARRLFDRWVWWRLSAAGLALVASAAWVVITSANATTATAALLLIAAGLAGAVTEFYYHLFRGLSRTDLESTLTLGSRLAALALGSAALLLRPTLLTFGSVMLAVNAATTVIAARVALTIAAPVPSDAMLGHVDRWGEFVREALPIGIGVVLSALYFRIDLLLLERWQGAEVAGGYNAVFRIVEALRLVPAAAIAVALPALCRADSHCVAARLAMQLTAAATTVSVILWLLADWLIPFCYGPSFASAVPAFRILLAAFPLMAFNYALTTQLVAWNRHAAFAVLCGAALAFNIALNRVLIPGRSLDGAAWTTLWTEVVLMLGCVALLGAARARPGPMLTTAVTR